MRSSGKRTAAIFLAALMSAAYPAYAAELGQARTVLDLDAPIASPEMIAPYVGEVLALDDLGISVLAASYERAEQKDGFVYLYTMREDSIPYIIIGKYDVQASNFVPSFTEYMKGTYADLRVTREEEEVTLADRTFRSIVYEYSTGSYPIRDTRMFCELGTSTFMFGAKEELSLDYYLPAGALEQVASSVELLVDGEGNYRKHVNSADGVWGPVMSQETADAFPKELRLAGISVAEVILSDYVDDEGLLIDEEAVNTQTAANDGSEGSGEEVNSGTDVTGDDAGSAGVDEDGDASTGALEDQDFFADLDQEASAADAGRLPVRFEDGFQLFLPPDWEIVELMEGEQADGGLFCAGEGSGADNAPFVCVSWAASEEKTLQEIAQSIVDQGYTSEGIVRVNGIDCIGYYSEDLDVRGLVFLHPRSTDFVYVLTATQVSYHTSLLNGILGSFGPLM